MVKYVDYISLILAKGEITQTPGAEITQIGPIKHYNPGEERAQSVVGAKRSSIEFHI